MRDDQKSGFVEGPKALRVVGLIAAGVFGLILQPMLEVADPFALLVCGILVVICALGVAAGTVTPLSKREEWYFSFVFYVTAASIIWTVGQAWFEQRRADRICSRIQHIMLYEHRKRADVPEIFRSLGCKLQS